MKTPWEYYIEMCGEFSKNLTDKSEEEKELDEKELLYEMFNLSIKNQELLSESWKLGIGYQKLFIKFMKLTKGGD